METLNAKEFESRYGVAATTRFEQKEREESFFEAIKRDLQQRGEENVSLLEGGGSPLTQGFEIAANTAGGVGNVLGEAITRTPFIGPLVGKAADTVQSGFESLTDKLGGTKFFGEAAAGLDKDSTVEQGLRIGSAGGRIAENVLVAGVGTGAARAVTRKSGDTAVRTGQAVRDRLPETPQGVGQAVRDVVPTRQAVINTQVAKALDLTPGDLNNIYRSTGNDVGDWMARNNLIGTNKSSTEALINDFFRKNYEDVRNSIAAVEKTYKPVQVPRYTDSLKAIKLQIDEVPGLEKSSAEVSNLLSKKNNITLNDVQRVKELLDDHFELYKATGDVKAGVAKEGLASIRRELKEFIEKEVGSETGKNIRSMNQDVATAKTVADAVTTRSPRGLTRGSLSLKDILVGLGLGAGYGSPIVGVAAAFLSKLATSPTARLRFARWLDNKSDAEKRRISEELQKGRVPAEAEEVINGQSGASTPTQ